MDKNMQDPVSKDTNRLCKCSENPKKTTKNADKLSATGDQLSRIYQDRYKEIFDNGDGAAILQIQPVKEVGLTSPIFIKFVLTCRA